MRLVEQQVLATFTQKRASYPKLFRLSAIAAVTISPQWVKVASVRSLEFYFGP